MLQNLYNLSDMGAKYKVTDSRAFSAFAVWNRAARCRTAILSGGFNV
jgi:hypothetical protein